MKPLLELVEDYGEACYEHGRLGADFSAEEAYDKAGELLTEIRQRIEADADRLAGLERDAARYRFIEKNCHAEYHPATCDYWQIAGEFKAASEIEGLAEAIDAAMAEGE